MFDKLLASVGIGAAGVDTCLSNMNAIPGGIVEGKVRVTGGNVAQTIEEIYFYIATEYKRESGDLTYTEEGKLLKYQVTSGFTLEPGEEKTFPIAVEIPYQTPLSLKQQKVYIRTGVDIELAVNPNDVDALSIQPHPLMQHFLDGLQALGFHLHQVTCNYNTRLGRDYPFVQELCFVPKGKYQGKLDELEVVFYLEPDRLEVLLVVDKRGKGLGGLLSDAFDLDESYRRLYITAEDLEQPVESLFDLIEDAIA